MFYFLTFKKYFSSEFCKFVTAVYIIVCKRFSPRLYNCLSHDMYTCASLLYAVVSYGAYSDFRFYCMQNVDAEFRFLYNDHNCGVAARPDHTAYQMSNR